MKIHLAVAALAAALIPAAGFASSAVVAHVLNFGAYGNGNLYVQLDQTIDQAGCPLPNLELPSNGSVNKTVLAVLALAQATGSSIEVKTDVCYNGSPSLDPTGRTGFIISQPH